MDVCGKERNSSKITEYRACYQLPENSSLLRSLECKFISTHHYHARAEARNISLMGEETGLFNVAKSRLYMSPE